MASRSSSRALLLSILAAMLFIVAPSQAVVYTVANQTQLDNAISSLVQGDKVVFVDNVNLSGPVNIAGLQDITLVMAENPTKIGQGTVGIGGFNFTNGASAQISSAGACITIADSSRVRVVGLRLRCQTGIHVQNSQDVQILGNKLFVTGVGVRLDSAEGSVVASNRIKKQSGGSPLAVGIAVGLGLDNLLFDNEIEDPQDIGIVVDGSAVRTALINNFVDTSGLIPVLGIQDDGQSGCLLRNTAEGSLHPFLVGCSAPTLIGNRALTTGFSNICVPPPAAHQNHL